MLDRLELLAQVLMTQAKNLETMYKNLHFAKNDPKKLVKESVPDNTRLKERRA
jgi:hypothetical protein